MEIIHWDRWASCGFSQEDFLDWWTTTPSIFNFVTVFLYFWHSLTGFIPSWIKVASFKNMENSNHLWQFLCRTDFLKEKIFSARFRNNKPYLDIGDAIMNLWTVTYLKICDRGVKILLFDEPSLRSRFLLFQRSMDCGLQSEQQKLISEVMVAILTYSTHPTYWLLLETDLVGPNPAHPKSSRRVRISHLNSLYRVPLDT